MSCLACLCCCCPCFPCYKGCPKLVFPLDEAEKEAEAKRIQAQEEKINNEPEYKEINFQPARPSQYENQNQENYQTGNNGIPKFINGPYNSGQTEDRGANEVMTPEPTLRTVEDSYNRTSSSLNDEALIVNKAPTVNLRNSTMGWVGV